MGKKGITRIQSIKIGLVPIRIDDGRPGGQRPSAACARNGVEGIWKPARIESCGQAIRRGRFGQFIPYDGFMHYPYHIHPCNFSAFQLAYSLKPPYFPQIHYLK